MVADDWQEWARARLDNYTDAMAKDAAELARIEARMRARAAGVYDVTSLEAVEDWLALAAVDSHLGDRCGYANDIGYGLFDIDDPTPAEEAELARAVVVERRNNALDTLRSGLSIAIRRNLGAEELDVALAMLHSDVEEKFAREYGRDPHLALDYQTDTVEDIETIIKRFKADGEMSEAKTKTARSSRGLRRLLRQHPRRRPGPSARAGAVAHGVNPYVRGGAGFPLPGSPPSRRAIALTDEQVSQILAALAARAETRRGWLP